MEMQKRPLSGMVVGNKSTPPVIVSATAAVLIHQLDYSQNGYLDQVTLEIWNVDPTNDQVLRVTVCGQAMDIQIAALSQVVVFNAQPFFGAPNSATSSQITVQNVDSSPVAGALLAFGHFSRG